VQKEFKPISASAVCLINQMEKGFTPSWPYGKLIPIYPPLQCITIWFSV